MIETKREVGVLATRQPWEMGGAVCPLRVYHPSARGLSVHRPQKPPAAVPGEMEMCSESKSDVVRW